MGYPTLTPALIRILHLSPVGDMMPYSKKEKKKTNKLLDKLAKKENLDVEITYLDDVSSIKR